MYNFTFEKPFINLYENVIFFFKLRYERVPLHALIAIVYRPCLNTALQPNINEKKLY